MTYNPWVLYPICMRVYIYAPCMENYTYILAQIYGTCKINNSIAMESIWVCRRLCRVVSCSSWQAGASHHKLRDLQRSPLQTWEVTTTVVMIVNL